MGCGDGVVSRETLAHILLNSFGFTALFVGLCLPACGYRSPYLPESTRAFSVAAAPLKTPHFDALEAALSGVRTGLSEAGSLSSAGSFPRVLVEVLRVDELPAGMAALPALRGPLPGGRGSAVGVVARAWVVSAAGGAPS